MHEAAFFSLLARELGERAARACVSQISPRNEPLRKHLLAALAGAPGSAAAFLAHPVFETLFEWEGSNNSLSEMGLLHESLIAALAKNGRLGDESIDALFPRGRKPYLHQEKAWRALLEPPGKSVLVRTGTSSGKTESFLVPVLDTLVRELAGKPTKAPLVGVRALFLYPLNALINSQRERLLAGTLPFDGRLRFCLYNGNTKERLPERDRLRGPEVMDRLLLRQAPPPMLITNATMLEYMLVRQSDAPILQNSAGKLRYIVLDEAHTYLGSAAAEIALLPRRVVQAFQVRPQDVRFVATSATIGGDEAEEKLRQFLAQLAGMPAEQVVVVSGKRVAPALPAAYTEKKGSLPRGDGLNGEGVAERLASSAVFRQLRLELNGAPQSLEQIKAGLGTDLENDEVIRILDAASGAQLEGQNLLPLRGHFFMRTLEGLWCCTNTHCSGRKGTSLDEESWPFGKVFFSRRERCDACRSLVAEQVVCRRCGEIYAVVEELDGKLSAAEWAIGQDFDADDEGPSDPLQDDDEDGSEDRGNIQLLSTNHGARALDCSVGPTYAYDPTTGDLGQGPAQVRFASRTQSSRTLRCGTCGGTHGRERSVFRRARLGVNFLLRNALWTVGERMPPAEAHEPLPAQGRRLITFTDSRQGTARHALQSQIEAERAWTRAYTYHYLWSEERRQGGASDEAARKLEAEIESFKQMLQQAPALQSHIDAKAAELAKLRAEGPKGVKWSDLRKNLCNERTAAWIRDAMKRSYEPAELDETQQAELWLLREFGRPLPREASLENLGLVRLCYPSLRSKAPGSWRTRGLNESAWRDLLVFLLDAFVRSSTPILIERKVSRWLGQHFSPRYLVDQQVEGDFKAVPWPSATRPRPTKVVGVLFQALALNAERTEDRELLTHLLRDAWMQLREGPYLKRGETGWLFALEDVHIASVQDAMLCPVTGRVQGATFLGFSQHWNRCEIAPLWWTPGEGLRSLEIHRCSTENHAQIRSRKTPCAV